MSVLIKGGTVVTAEQMFRADVLCEDGSRPGVFSWRPPTGLVTGLSDLLAGTR